MAELKSLGTIFPNLLVDDGGGLIATIPALESWFDLAFPVLGSLAAAAAWREKYGPLVDSLCLADGSTIRITEQSDANTLAVVSAARGALLANTGNAKNSLNTTAPTANPFRDAKTQDQDIAYARLLAVASSMYFAVEKKTRK